jgi:uracil-DNA glycosylase
MNFGGKSLIPKDIDLKPYHKLLSQSWFEQIGWVLFTQHMAEVSAYVANRRQVTTQLTGADKVLPPKKEVFRAFQLTPFEKVKVVIIGQDPYPDENACGLAFSCKTNMSASLRVLQKELINTYEVGDFLHWNEKPQLDYLAEQGVLLINTALTVEEGIIAAHSQIGWDFLVKEAITKLIVNGGPIVFMLWGNHAKGIFEELTNNPNQFTKVEEITHLRGINPNDLNRHKIIQTPHPMVEVYDGKVKKFYGTNVFRIADRFLMDNKMSKIMW